jgi:hypothetical protein
MWPGTKVPSPSKSVSTDSSDDADLFIENNMKKFKKNTENKSKSANTGSSDHTDFCAE